jgi:hypothetical protein
MAAAGKILSGRRVFIAFFAAVTICVILAFAFFPANFPSNFGHGSQWLPKPLQPSKSPMDSSVPTKSL